MNYGSLWGSKGPLWGRGGFKTKWYKLFSFKTVLGLINIDGWVGGGGCLDKIKQRLTHPVWAELEFGSGICKFFKNCTLSWKTLVKLGTYKSGQRRMETFLYYLPHYDL